jgi:indolepyruvate ferredoxin oxidoreductase beta subunit
MTTCDLLLVGVGGQGVLTIGDLLLRAAFAADLPASFCPSKGMAQRGGFVKVELRLGADGVGPRIGEGSADIVVAMERSEALKGIPFTKPDGHFLLYDHVWEPTGVQLGVDEYPSLDDVSDAIEASGAQLTVRHPAERPEIDGRPVSANVFLLGALMALPKMSALFAVADVEWVIETRWPKSADANVSAFRAGLSTSGGPAE